MSPPALPPRARPGDGTSIGLGALVPLTRPGYVEAGRHLLAGLELAVEEVNDSGGIDGRPLELVVRDTAADPHRGSAAVAELAELGVAALVGEYHSVVARAVAAEADALGVPFLCSSSVLDALTDEATDWVARLAPPQSRGWRCYADFLRDAGTQQIAVVTQPSIYWASGTRLLRDYLGPSGGTVVELEADGRTAESICDSLAEHRPAALLLLVGHPQPAARIVSAVRRDPRLAGILIGAPAGQPEFNEWWEALGDDGAGISFLRYLPPRLGPRGRRVAQELRRRLGEPVSFVAFEGWDAIAVLAETLRSHGTDRAVIAESWGRVATEGTRGPIRFSRPPGSTVWQWEQAPVQVVQRDPASPEHFQILRSG